METQAKGKSVSEVLLDKHGIEATPGKKVTCPKCEKDNLQVFKHDESAYCFSPGCAHIVRAFSASEVLEDEIQQRLARFYALCKQDFLSQKIFAEKQLAKDAYDFCLNDRRIDSRVLDQAMIGSVPADFDVDQHFGDLHRQFTEAIQKRNEIIAGKPDDEKAKAELKCLQEQLALLDGWINGLKRYISSTGKRITGWLCFFYTDAHLNITSVRFREPYHHRFYTCSPGQACGVFGLTLMEELLSFSSRTKLKDMLVTEGEFNVLQAQSLGYRRAETIQTGRVSQSIVGVGGVQVADFKTVKSLCRVPTLCCDNDPDQAGLQLIEKATKLSSVYAITPPLEDGETKSDLDSFILSYGDDTDTAWNEFSSLLQKRTFHPRQWRFVADEVRAIRRKKGWKPFEISQRVRDIVREDLQDRGEFLRTSQSEIGYFFDYASRQVWELGSEGVEFRQLLRNYDVNPAEDLFNYLGCDIRLHALSDGRQTQIYRYCHYDLKRNVIYLHNQNMVIRIGESKIESVSNGTDGYLFTSDKRMEAFTPKLDTEPTTDYFEKYIIREVNFSNGSTLADEKRILLMLWIYGLFFDELMPTKVILGLIGAKGSGKSSTLRFLLKCMFGKDFDLTAIGDDAKDFDAKISNSYVACLDNVDEQVKWLEDKLAVIATGGTLSRREYFTTNKLVEFKAGCFLAVTSRTPHFRRDDISDRLLPLDLERRVKEDENKQIQGNFEAESRLLAEVYSHRDEIMTELIFRLQDCLRALAASQEVRYRGTFRMADFAEFAMRISRSAGVETEIADILHRLSSAQSEFTVKYDPIFILIGKLLDAEGGSVKLKTGELCDWLSKIAAKEFIRFPYAGNAISLGRRLETLKDDFSKFFEVRVTHPQGSTTWGFRKREKECA